MRDPLCLIRPLNEGTTRAASFDHLFGRVTTIPFRR
jgi:hypothetical protein